MIFMGGWMKGRALLFAVMGVVFIVIGLMSPSIVRSTFLIIGVADLVVAAFSFWLGRRTEPQDPAAPGGGGNWIG